MRKSNVVHILARRLRIGAGRIEAISQRLAEVGRICRTEGSRRYPPDISEPEIVNLVLAVLADQGLTNVNRSIDIFAPLESHSGQRFEDSLSDLMFSPTPRDIRSLVVRHDPPGATLLADGQHSVFGADAPLSASTKATIVPGAALAAIALELQGLSESEADGSLAIARLRRALA